MNKPINQPKVLLLVVLLWVCRMSTATVAMALDVGQKAPDFKLPATTGLDISLNDFKGKKWVFLEFYGGAFVPT